MYGHCRQWSVESGEGFPHPRSSACICGSRRARNSSFILHPSSFFPNPQSPIANPSRSGFTLVELLVTIVIIGILAGMVMGALSMAREAAKEYATKATIAKLHTIIMERYESYMNRRVPIQIPPGTQRTAAAQDRLYGLRDLMRMEMPDHRNDILSIPIVLPNTGTAIRRPPLSQLYLNWYNSSSFKPDANFQNGPAELLYVIVSLGSPEAMEQFNQSEIGDVDGDGRFEFVDGWGRPIFFLRWAPGYTSLSNIQRATDPDPFDPRGIDGMSHNLIPLIYSAGSNTDPQIDIQGDYDFARTDGDMFANSEFLKMGAPVSSSAAGNITNHSIEQR